MRLGTWVEWRAYLFRGRHGWASVALIVCGAVALWLLPHVQDSIRRVGLVYEVVGVAVVMRQLWKTTTKHGRTHWPARIKQYLRDAPLFKWPTGQTLPADGNAYALMGSEIPMRHYPPPNATTDQKVDFLMRSLASLKDRVDNFASDTLSRVKVLQDALDTEKRERQQQSEATAKALVDVETGPLDLSAFGLFWLLVGMLMTTATQEVHSVLRFLGW